MGYYNYVHAMQTCFQESDCLHAVREAYQVCISMKSNTTGTYFFLPSDVLQ
jgi:hypothetical protein